MCVCFNANITEKAMAVEDLGFMSAEAPACRRAASVPSGCRPHRAFSRNPVPPLDFCWVDICRDLTQQDDIEEKKNWKDVRKTRVKMG